MSHVPDTDNNSDFSPTSTFLSYGSLKEVRLNTTYMNDADVDKHCTPLTWSNCDATTFNVRKGPNYPKNGEKAASDVSLYNVFAADCYKSPNKINKISQFINLSDRIKSNTIHEYNFNSWPLPPILIINFMVPNYSPPISMFGYSEDQIDGDGFSVVLYAEMSEYTRNWLNKLYNNEISKSELPNSLRLLINFIHASETRNSSGRSKDIADNNNGHDNSGDTKEEENLADKYNMTEDVMKELLNRFKVITRVMNYSKSQIPLSMKPLISRYNAKPFLARTSTTFYHEHGRYFAIDIDAHVFGKLARKSLGYVRGCMESIIFDTGFVIEGLDDKELPEQMLCCARISKIGMNVVNEFNTDLLNEYLERKEKNEHLLWKYDINTKEWTKKNILSTDKDTVSGDEKEIDGSGKIDRRKTAE